MTDKIKREREGEREKGEIKIEKETGENTERERKYD